MKTKNEQLMIIQALGTCIARKKQKSNRLQRILANAEDEWQTGLHKIRRNVYKGLEEIKEFEILKLKLENEYATKGWIKIKSEDYLPKESGEYWVVNIDLDDDNEIFGCWYNSTKKVWNYKGDEQTVTHYQTIEIPQPPVQ